VAHGILVALTNVVGHKSSVIALAKILLEETDDRKLSILIDLYKQQLVENEILKCTDQVKQLFEKHLDTDGLYIMDMTERATSLLNMWKIILIKANEEVRENEEFIEIKKFVDEKCEQIGVIVE